MVHAVILLGYGGCFLVDRTLHAAAQDRSCRDMEDIASSIARIQKGQCCGTKAATLSVFCKHATTQRSSCRVMGLITCLSFYVLGFNLILLYKGLSSHLKELYLVISSKVSKIFVVLWT